MANKRICINVGHGGSGKSYDSGAIAADGTHEHAFNRDEFAPLLKRELECLGWTVDVVEQTTYARLPAAINAKNPALILSLHFNAYNASASGTETLYWHSSKRARRLAELVQGAMIKVLKLPNRGIKPKSTNDRGAPLLRGTNAPCVILEPGFCDNPGDLERIRAKMSVLAREIARAVNDFR